MLHSVKKFNDTPTVSEDIPQGTKFAYLPTEFSMKKGGKLVNGRVAYETIGTLNSAKTNAVLILTGLSPNAHVASNEENSAPGWWNEIVGQGKPVDTDKWFVICLNSLGSCKGSTGPASSQPYTSEPYRLRFPDLSIEDIAKSAVHTLHSLGIETLACVIGTSMGGMTALSMLAQYPGIARNHVNISGSTKPSTFAIAIRSLQREIIIKDPNWNSGNYCHAKDAIDGMISARKLGLMTYRSADEYEERFGRSKIDNYDSTSKPFEIEFQIESYLQHQSESFVNTFDPNSYLYLSRSMDWFDLDENSDGNSQPALRKILLENALILGVESDILFPIHQQQEIACGLENAGTNTYFSALPSPQGHDAFLVDIDRFGHQISEFFSEMNSL